MSSTRPIRILFFLVLLCCPVTAAAQAGMRTGDSTISGRVIFADTGRPVRRAAVHLLSNLNHPPVRITTANVRGEFRFNQVAAGSYFVRADVPGGVSPLAFAITEFGLDNDADAEHTRVTVDGKGATRCEVRVVRGATIKGTVLYADKEPVMAAQIALFRRKNGSTMPFFIERIYTNDRGMYRIDGLPDGEYFVGVMDSKRKALSVRPLEIRGVVTAYYPGVISITDAKAVQVQSGSEVNAINITLGDDELRQIAGVVKLRNSTERIVRATMTLRRKDEPKVDVPFDNLMRSITSPETENNDANMFRDIGLVMLMVPQFTEANEKGEWKIEDVPPGTYVLTAVVVLPSTDKTRRKSEYDEEIQDLPEEFQEPRSYSREMELIIRDEDLKDLVVEVSEGGRISGQVVSDEVPLPRVKVSAGHTAMDFLRDGSRTTRAYGTFELHGIPAGEVRLEATVTGDDLYVKSITLGSRDLMHNSIRVEEGAEVAGVRITVAKGLATLTGRALFDEGGALAPGSGVLLVKADPSLWHLPSARLFTVTDPAGEFELKCAPGQYLVFTWATGNQPLQAIEEFVRTHASRARSISLQSREEKRIELTVVKRQ